jgi:RHS repeat-associated protein
MTSALPSGQGYTRLELNCKYDYLGRRVEKKVENLDGPTPNFTHRYVYDGWNLIAEYAYASSTLTLTRSYTWGLDIARTLTDAGGVGALLQVVDHASGKAWHPAYDGNGNIAALVNGSGGAVVAVYEYSPFGELLRHVVHDSAAAGQPFRFSSKFTDDETGLVYYGRRYYDTKNGRFINKDPIDEAGGLNLYGFCGNNAVNRWDLLGLSWYVEFTGEGTYKSFSTDSNGNTGVWNFGSLEDAENWARAWEAHDMNVVGDRAVTDAYLNNVQSGSSAVTPSVPMNGIIVSYSGGGPPSDQWTIGFATVAGRDYFTATWNTGQVYFFIYGAWYPLGGIADAARSFADPGNSGLTGDADRDLAFAYVWASRFYPAAFKGTALSNYSIGPLETGTLGWTNPYPFSGHNATIDYSQHTSMRELVGTVLHEALHRLGGHVSTTEPRHRRIYDVDLEAMNRFSDWQQNPQPPPPGGYPIPIL